ncbi:MAG: type II secretion system protein, partial [Lachnospiraceae bacterium]|nr:type II secretion system protein [Lachnospiraceae bacterium]
MKKNNKGFTLVELIAVIALLGILAMFAIPRIYSLITDSKKNVYIEDAIRLITQAQYAMNSKSVKIDKPDAGECIIISMKYLNSGDFQNPPNGGSYLPESSFVIVKNSGGDYVYSAMLVERLKDGSLMGVELSTESALNAKNALKHVRVFRDDEIAFINEDGGIDAGFINETIHRGDDEDDDKIIGFYNEEHEDEEIVIDTSIPKFTAKFSSSGTLQTTLSISASDADNSKDELKVCLKISDNSNDTYPDPTVQADVDDYCEGYGTGAFYTKYIDFSLAENGSFTYESRRSAYVYIAVFDPNNNVVRKKMTYDIHENEPPVISLFTINHHPDDNHNMPRSRFILSLSDDMDNQENLQICFLQDDLYGTCADADFKPYSYFFGPTNIYDYTFKDSNGMGITYPDGSHHNVTVFVKDSMGEMVRATAYYNIYQNAVPTITMNSIVPECLFKKADGSCNCNNCNSLTFTINMTITD